MLIGGNRKECPVFKIFRNLSYWNEFPEQRPHIVVNIWQLSNPAGTPIVIAAKKSDMPPKKSPNTWIMIHQ